MPYTPKRQLKEGPEINWWFVIVAAVITFGVSIFLGRWIGTALISSRAGVSSAPAAEQAYAPPSPPPITVPVPSSEAVPRENVSNPALQVPPPVAETPPPPSPSPSVSPSSSPAQSQGVGINPPFKVQVGAFTSQKNAVELQKALNQDGFNTGMDTIMQNGASYFQIYLGPYQDIKMAQSIAHELTLLGYQTLVVGQPASPPPTPQASSPAPPTASPVPPSPSPGSSPAASPKGH